MEQASTDYNDANDALSPPLAIVPVSKRRRLDSTHLQKNSIVAVMFKYDVSTDTFEQENVILDRATLEAQQASRTDADREEIIRYLIVYSGVVSQADRFFGPTIMYISELDKFYLLSSEEYREWSALVRRLQSLREYELQFGLASPFNCSWDRPRDLSDKLITGIKVQSKNIKVKLNTLEYNASAVRYYTSYAELMDEIDLSNGGAIRRVKSGKGILIINSVLHVFLDRDHEKLRDGIWSYKDRGKFYTVKVPAKSMALYITILNKEHTVIYHGDPINN